MVLCELRPPVHPIGNCSSSDSATAETLSNGENLARRAQSMGVGAIADGGFSVTAICNVDPGTRCGSWSVEGIGWTAATLLL